MTFEEKLKELLVQHGMFESQAQIVIDRTKAHEHNEAMADRWGDQVEDYLPQMLNILWASAQAGALTYIDEACPEAWFRPMFVRENA